MSSANRLITLFHRRWATPVLAELHRLDGAKFVTLSRRLGASPLAIRQTLDDLIRNGWVRRNPGYGHPLRPEYVLTLRGDRIAPACGLLNDALTALNLRAVGLKKWSMPVVYAVTGGARRFTDLAEQLAGITDRALALSLKDLTHADLIERNLIESFPPASAYAPTSTGASFAPILGRLAGA
jgi:DNA-binding HxlR family transcriptional regulator